MAADGSVAGIPTTTSSLFTVQVADSAGQTAAAGTAIPIAPALAATNLCGANGCSVEAGCDTVCGVFGQQSGGVPPFQYLPTGSPPRGTSINGLALIGTILYSATFAVDIKDSLGASVSVAPVIFNVSPHLLLSNGSGRGPFPNGPVTVGMALSSNDPNITAVTTNPPYKVTAFSYDGKVLTITLQGNWTTKAPPPFQATVYDSQPCGPGVNCSSTAMVTLTLF